MKITSSLALRHLQKNKKQTFSALLAITLSVSMLVAVSTFCFSVYESTVEFANAHDLMSIMESSLSSVQVLGSFLGAIVALAAIVVISNAFDIQASERAKQFGILKSVGATKEQIRSTITAESNQLSLIGIPVGIVVGHLLCFAAMFVLKSYTDADTNGGTAMSYAVRFNLIAILLAAALGYASVRFASSLTARKVSRLTAIEAIRQTDEVKIESGKLRTSKTLNKIFGFEGTLAAKQLKRNKRKFRVTVLSLVTSIVLFLSAFSFGDTLIKTALGAYANTGANVVSEVSGSSSNFSAFDDYAKKIKAQNITDMHTLYSYQYAPDHGDWYNIIIMDDADYDAYCKQAKVKPGTNIYLKHHNVDRSVPFDVSLPDLGNVNFSVTESATLTNPYLKSLTMTSHPNIIIPRGEAQKLNLPIEAHYYIITPNAIDLISKIKPENASFDSYYIHNTEEYTRELQRMYTMLMIFVYCFIGMLTLIGATSVLSTINNNINLRKGEFATLQAVGMETKQLHKMLNMESILYGVKSLLYGLPIGLLLSYFMHGLSLSGNTRLSPEEAAKFPFEIPYLGILCCVFGVFVINFTSMYFATSKLRRSNIAESMRELTT